MKLWEIKADALRLMFADSDIQFSKEEFENGSLMANGNTREKLTRIDASVKRAIDMYYQITGQYAKKTIVKYELDNEGEVTNVLDISNVNDFGIPTKIILKPNNYIKQGEGLDFFFDNITKKVYVYFDERYKSLLKDLEFIVYYFVDKKNLPENYDEIEFDLNTLNIPEEVQRVIPKFVKGELYEEDEASMAIMAKQDYMEFLITYAKKISSVSTKVKSKFIRG